MHISLSVLSYNFLDTPTTFLEKFIIDKYISQKNIKTLYAKLHIYGLDGVEMVLHNNFTDKDTEEIRNLFQKLKIPIRSVHQPIRLRSIATIQEVERVFHAAKRLGAKIIVLHSDMAGKQLLHSKYTKSIKSLEKKYGITAAFENMQKHYVISPDPLCYDPKKFQKIMQKNQLSITLDTTHLGQVKGDLITFFQDNKNLIKNIHISDFHPHFFSSVTLFPKYKFHMALGKGKLPMKEFLQILKKEKYTGNITIEIPRSFNEVLHSTKTINKYIS